MLSFNNKIKTFVATGLVLVATQVGAQVSKQKIRFNKFAIGLNIAHLYDLNINSYQQSNTGIKLQDMQGLKGPKTKFDLAYGIDATYFVSPVLSLDFGYSFGTMSGAADVDYYTSKIDYYTLGGNFNLKRGNRTVGYSFVPYLRAAVSYANFDASRKFKEDDAEFSREKGSTLQTSIGVGVKYHFNNHFAVKLQSEYVTTFTDAWDGYDYGTGRDYMVRTTLGVMYTFGKHLNVDRTLAWGASANSQELNDKIQAMKLSMNDSIQQMRNEIDAALERLAIQQREQIKDTDHDGVIDRNDYCPNDYGPAFNNGCPLDQGMVETPATSAVDSVEVFDSVTEVKPLMATNTINAVDTFIKGTDTVFVKKNTPEQTTQVVVGLDTVKTVVARKVQVNASPKVAKVYASVEQHPAYQKYVKNSVPASTQQDNTYLKPIIMLELKTIHFNPGQSNITYKALEELVSIAPILKENPKLKLVIIGHSDTDGSSAMNQLLALNRAKRIYTFLVQSGVSKKQLEVRSMGKNSPLARGQNYYSKRLNRRVQFKVEVLK